MFSLEEKLKHVFLADLPEASVRIPKVGNGTLEDLRNVLRDAVKSLFPGSYPIIINTYENRVVIEIEQQGKTLLFEIPYEVLKGSITLGTPIQVQKKVSYTKMEARTGISLDGKRRQQRLAGVGGEEYPDLREDKDGKTELRESLFDDAGVKILREEVLLEEKVKKPMVIQGIAARADTVNDNDRLYPKSVLLRQVTALQSKIEEGALLSELDHPMPIGSHGRLGHTAAKITNLNMDGNDLIFTAEVLSTPIGNILQGLIKSGVRVGVSTRGFGDWRQERRDGKEVKIIKDDYELAGIDFVSEPACSAARIVN